MLIKNNFNYPAMLNLAKKACFIVGGGVVAARKFATLANCDAKITIISPELCEELLAEIAKYPCAIIKEKYSTEYLQGAFLVIAATDSKKVNRAVTADAPCLVNNITEPELGNFTVPATVSEGSITLALATGGMPAFTRILKAHLAKSITPELADFNDFLIKAREQVKDIPSKPTERTAFWRQVLTKDLLELVLIGNTTTAKEKVLNAISSFRTQSQNSTR